MRIPATSTRAARYAAPAALSCAAVLGFSLNGACSYGGSSGSSGPTTPPPTVPLAARYVLQSVNGLPLPVTLRNVGTRTESVLADTLVFDVTNPTAATVGYVEVTIIETRDGGGAGVVTRQESPAGARRLTRDGPSGLGLSEFVGGTRPSGGLTPPAGTLPATLTVYAPTGFSWRYLAR